MKTFSVGGAAACLRAVVDDRVDAAALQRREDGLVHLAGISLFSDRVVIDSDRVDCVEVLRLRWKRIVPLAHEVFRVLQGWPSQPHLPGFLQPGSVPVRGVLRVDEAARPHRPGKQLRGVATPGAQLGHAHPRSDAEEREHGSRLAV